MAAGFDREIKRIEAEIARQRKRIGDAVKRHADKVLAADTEYNGTVDMIQPIIDSLNKTLEAMKATADSTQKPA